MGAVFGIAVRPRKMRFKARLYLVMILYYERYKTPLALDLWGIWTIYRSGGKTNIKKHPVGAERNDAPERGAEQSRFCAL